MPYPTWLAKINKRVFNLREIRRGMRLKQGQDHPGGTHVDIATVFADMRGSTPSAERLGDRAFT